MCSYNKKCVIKIITVNNKTVQVKGVKELKGLGFRVNGIRNVVCRETGHWLCTCYFFVVMLDLI